MEKEFIDYTEALALKALGFDEPCFAWYVSKEYGLEIGISIQTDLIKDAVVAPTYSAAFRFFREKQGLIYSIGHVGHTNTWVYEIINMRIAGPDYGYGETYEETELACLVKLIELVKK